MNFDQASELSAFAPRLAWQHDAACARAIHSASDPALAREIAAAFFPTQGESNMFAKALCATCAVRAPCLDYGLEHAYHGIWGGTTERERRRIRAHNNAPRQEVQTA